MQSNGLSERPKMRFATFWAGATLPALDRACLASVVRLGHAITLYSFEPVANPPEGVSVGDASAILPSSALHAFIHNGRPDLSHFSDYFRYKLFAATDEAWIDTDMLMLAPIDLPPAPNFFARETPSSLCGAIMRIDPAGAALPELLRRSEQLMHTELAWGATGPRLLGQVIGKRAMLEQAHEPAQFFPIHYDDFTKPFLAEHRDECERACEHAYTLHLWNNIVVRLGYWKELAPPEGSFLWSRLKALDLLGYFRDTYPASVMSQLVANWQYRKTGADVGALGVARQVVPSIMRSAVPRIRTLIQSHLH